MFAHLSIDLREVPVKELFFPTIAIETAKSAYGGSPIRSDARKAIESSNSSLAIVAKEIHDALSVRGNAE